VPSEFGRLSGGNSELTAEMLNRVMEYVRRQGRIYAVQPLRVVQQDEGWQVSIDGGAAGWG
jgi:hypothetical protein